VRTMSPAAACRESGVKSLGGIDRERCHHRASKAAGVPVGALRYSHECVDTVMRMRSRASQLARLHAWCSTVDEISSEDRFWCTLVLGSFLGYLFWGVG
jgi:hypothetical protein